MRYQTALRPECPPTFCGEWRILTSHVVGTTKTVCTTNPGEQPNPSLRSPEQAGEPTWAHDSCAHHARSSSKNTALVWSDGQPCAFRHIGVALRHAPQVRGASLTFDHRRSFCGGFLPRWLSCPAGCWPDRSGRPAGRFVGLSRAGRWCRRDLAQGCSALACHDPRDDQRDRRGVSRDALFNRATPLGRACRSYPPVAHRAFGLAGDRHRGRGVGNSVWRFVPTHVTTGTIIGGLSRGALVVVACPVAHRGIRSPGTRAV